MRPIFSSTVWLSIPYPRKPKRALNVIRDSSGEVTYVISTPNAPNVIDPNKIIHNAIGGFNPKSTRI